MTAVILYMSLNYCSPKAPSTFILLIFIQSRFIVKNPEAPRESGSEIEVLLQKRKASAKLEAVSDTIFIRTFFCYWCDFSARDIHWHCKNLLKNALFICCWGKVETWSIDMLNINFPMVFFNLLWRTWSLIDLGKIKKT